MIISQEELLIIKAKQQLTGFFHCESGYDVIDLIDGMGLTYEEWFDIRESGEFEYVPNDILNDISNHLVTNLINSNNEKCFNIKNKKS